MQQSTGAVCPAPISPRHACWSVCGLASCLPLVLFIAAAALFFGVLAASFVPQRYIASATLVLADGRGLAPVGDTPFAAAAIISSPDFAREVVARLGLTDSQQLTPEQMPSFMVRWLSVLGVMRPLPEMQAEAVLVRAYLDALKTSAADDARALIVSIRAHAPEMAARAANMTAQVYLDRRHAAVEARDIAINAARQKVVQAQAVLEQAINTESTFRNNPGGADTARRARTAADNLALLIVERAALVVERDAISRRLTSVEAMGDSADLFQVPFEGVSLLRHLVEQRLSLRVDLAAERRIREARDWRVRALSARAAAVDGQIAEASVSAREWLAGERDYLVKRITEVENAIRLRQAIVAAAADNSERYAALERAVASARMQLSLERERLDDEIARVRAGATAAYVLKAAEPPQQPDRTWPVIIGAIAGLMTVLLLSSLVGSGTCAFYAVVNKDSRKEGAGTDISPVHAPASAASGFNAADNQTAGGEGYESNVLSMQAQEIASASTTPDAPTAIKSSLRANDVSVPAAILDTPFTVVHIDKGEGALETVLNRLAIAPRADGGRHLLVVGVDARGKAPDIALALARYLAVRERVMLLDLSASRSVEEMSTPGFTDLLAGRASFSEIITRDSGSRLHQVARGGSAVDADQLGDGTELALAALDQTYDWIVQVFATQDQDGLARRAIKHANGVVLAAKGEAIDVETFAAYEALREKGLDNIVVALSA
ncbi:hypothetical protein [Pseudochelatococcus sp. G4_1912]|uniref:hypothetical protein n=1 Tax=Pseudochelatococcus sp. G4_1912 TaxID=3114288 RepID=UPI0039C5B977